MVDGSTTTTLPARAENTRFADHIGQIPKPIAVRAFYRWAKETHVPDAMTTYK